MPNTSSAEKQVRVSRRRYAHNKSVRSKVKTEITGAEALIASGKLDEGRQAALAAISALDKAAEKKVIHRNNAARRKSRLTKKLNKAAAKPVTKPEQTA